MGLLTLSEFREELTRISGNRGIDQWVIDRAVNMALQEITGAIEFNALVQMISTSTSNSVNYLQLPSDVFGIKSVSIPSEKIRLLKVGEQEFVLRDPQSSGVPEIFCRIGNLLYLWPTPNAQYTVSMIVRKEHPVLSGGDSKTLIPGHWDQAVIGLAASYLFASFEEMEQSAFWFNKAATVIRSREEDPEYDMEGTPVPIQVPRRYSDIMRFRWSGEE